MKIYFCAFVAVSIAAGPALAGEVASQHYSKAVQQACASDCIVFGNVNDPESQVAQIRKNDKERVFYVLEQIHTLPNVNYLSKIRNTDKIVGGNEVTDGMMKEHI